MHTKHTQFGLTAQIFLSYCLAGMSAAIAYMLLAPLHLSALMTLACAGLVGGCVGILFTFNIQRGLVHMEQVLFSLARGQAVSVREASWQWPLTALFTHVHRLSRLIEEYTQREMLTVEQRDQLLNRVGEAAAQEERNRLARELHDSIKQHIFSIGMSAAAIEERLSGGLGSAEIPLADLQQSVEVAQSEMDALVQQLRPAALSISGVIEHVYTQCQALGYRINGAATLEVGQLPASERLVATTGDALQRILQEALSNIARHARARSVTIFIGQQENVLLVEIRDDGQGFAVSEPTHGMGLANMQARASMLGGSLDIQSEPGNTVVSIRLPLLSITSEKLLEEQQAIKDQVRWTRILHGSADILLQLTGIAILLVLPFPLIGVGLCLALLSLGLAQKSQKHIVQFAGADSQEALVLSSRGDDIASGLCMIFAICVWYLPVALPGRSPLLMLALPAGFSLAAGVLIVLTTWRSQSSTASYLRLISARERTEANKQRLQQLLISASCWLGIVLLALFIGQFDLAFPPQTFSQWSSGAAVALLTFWPLLLSVNYLQHRLVLSTIDPLKESEGK